jgi:hypothetical protein
MPDHRRREEKWIIEEKKTRARQSQRATEAGRKVLHVWCACDPVCAVVVCAGPDSIFIQYHKKFRGPDCVMLIFVHNILFFVIQSPTNKYTLQLQFSFTEASYRFLFFPPVLRPSYKMQARAKAGGHARRTHKSYLVLFVMSVSTTISQNTHSFVAGLILGVYALGMYKKYLKNVQI